jgi:hypothetical protein
MQLKYRNRIITSSIFANFIIFFYSGVDKLLYFDQFVNNFSKSPFSPQQYLRELCAAIIFLEIGFSLLLFFDETKRISLIGFGILSFLFSLYISLMIFYSPYLPCSCGGIIDLLSWNEHLVLAICLFFLSFYSSYLIKNENK